MLDYISLLSLGQLLFSTLISSIFIYLIVFAINFYMDKFRGDVRPKGRLLKISAAISLAFFLISLAITLPNEKGAWDAKRVLLMNEAQEAHVTYPDGTQRTYSKSHMGSLSTTDFSSIKYSQISNNIGQAAAHIAFTENGRNTANVKLVKITNGDSLYSQQEQGIYKIGNEYFVAIGDEMIHKTILYSLDTNLGTAILSH